MTAKPILGLNDLVPLRLNPFFMLKLMYGINVMVRWTHLPHLNLCSCILQSYTVQFPCTVWSNYLNLFWVGHCHYAVGTVVKLSCCHEMRQNKNRLNHKNCSAFRYKFQSKYAMMLLPGLENTVKGKSAKVLLPFYLTCTCFYAWYSCLLI